jgi:proline iminopeptidase
MNLGARMAVCIAIGLCLSGATTPARPAEVVMPAVHEVSEQYVDADGVLIYVLSIGHGAPPAIVHGGPGTSHAYFLPYFLPLARLNRLVFIDERGSGKSEQIEDSSKYTVKAMVEDVEAVRQALGLGRVNLLGHSLGGVLAQAYAFKYQANLSHLVLCSTFHSAKAMNDVFDRMKEKMPAELRVRIDKMEAEGLYGHGREYERNRYTNEYMIAAWGEGHFPYLYRNRPEPNYDPVQAGNMSWALYREMWAPMGSS